MLGAILGAVSGLGSIFGGAGKGKADERMQQNDLISRNNNTQAALHNNKQQSILQLLGLLENAQRDRADRAMSAPADRARQSAMGSMMQNIQPAQISGLPSGVSIPQMSGGLNPSMLNAQARAGGGELQKQALMALLSKSDVPAMPKSEGALLPDPVLQAMKQPGKGESLLSMLGLFGGGIGALDQAGVFGGKKKPPLQGEYGGF
jgi:hypothetical protein